MYPVKIILTGKTFVMWRLANVNVIEAYYDDGQGLC